MWPSKGVSFGLLILSVVLEVFGEEVSDLIRKCFFLFYNFLNNFAGMIVKLTRERDVFKQVLFTKFRVSKRRFLSLFNRIF